MIAGGVFAPLVPLSPQNISIEPLSLLLLSSNISLPVHARKYGCHTYIKCKHAKMMKFLTMYGIVESDTACVINQNCVVQLFQHFQTLIGGCGRALA